MEDRSMSLLLVLFYFVGIPALVIAAAVWLWRKTDSFLARGLVMVGAMATLAGLLWLAEGEKWQADRQVRELCAKDGGVRVYETVRLPAEKFDEYGRPHFQIPSNAKMTSTDAYYYEEETTYLLAGNPSLYRFEFRIVRKSDGKVLGKSVFYSRGGGDLPGPWHESSLICPDPVKQRSDLRTAVFVKGDE
jgi:hypothetical protein